MNDENAPSNAQPPSTEAPSADAQTDEENARLEKLARTYRHIGYAIFGGLAFVVAAFLLYTALVSLKAHTVIDSQTGEPVYAE